MTDLKETLDAQDKAATPGVWEVHEYCNPSDRCMIWNDRHGSAMCIECVKEPDATFITALVNAYRSGDLIVKPDWETLWEILKDVFDAGWDSHRLSGQYSFDVKKSADAAITAIFGDET